VVTFTGQGDPRRTMELLWRLGPGPAVTSRGPKPAFTVDDIVAAATDIADGEGFEAVSMRAVGERLGRTAMAVYTYVPSKAELVDLMLDRTLEELDIGYDLTGGWRPAARRWALHSWDFYLRHPWVHQISTARPVLGPGTYASMERAAEVFASTGLGAADVLKVVGTVSGFVVGMTRQISELREASRAVGQTELEWWTQQSQLMTELVPDVGRRYPRLAAADADGAFDVEHEPEQYLEQEARNGFEFGLERLLDGIEAYVSRQEPRG
jgi:AcrR family transcriptional regulator